ncbi:hypothetical protein DFP72DRAFT_124519 [Ephemerocybe angulata]|uniref:Uncharacterized protein n=1 Tax=Ephemerocybe angulata TaxID=980116 RepID=A0A8H6HAT3_9AGAR|nr:hypothetical protein DFP72DRAFT_124519 [Tulosesus angulatus]
MAIVVKKEEELGCLLPLTSLKAETDWKEPEKPIIVDFTAVQSFLKSEDAKTLLPKKRFRYFLDAVVITTRPRAPVIKPQQLTASTRRTALKTESSQGNEISLPRAEDIIPGKASNKSKNNKKDVAQVGKSNSSRPSKQQSRSPVPPPKKSPPRLRTQTTSTKGPHAQTPQASNHENMKTKGKNPMKKIKKEAVTLSEDIKQSRLKAAGISPEA